MICTNVVPFAKRLVVEIGKTRQARKKGPAAAVEDEKIAVEIEVK